MVVNNSSVPVRLRKTVSILWVENWVSSHWGSWMEPWTTVILFDLGTEDSRRAALLVGRISVLTALDSVRSGTCSVPMLPEADVMKTLDMVMGLLWKNYVCLLEDGSESVYPYGLGFKAETRSDNEENCITRRYLYIRDSASHDHLSFRIHDIPSVGIWPPQMLATRIWSHTIL